jgi:hypothetical protein
VAAIVHCKHHGLIPPGSHKVTLHPCLCVHMSVMLVGVHTVWLCAQRRTCPLCVCVCVCARVWSLRLKTQGVTGPWGLCMM